MFSGFHIGRLGLCAVLLVCAAVHGAEPLDVFDAKGVAWRDEEGKAVKPRRLSGGRRGLRLGCDFSKGGERRTWDLIRRVPAAGYSFYTLWVRVDRPDAVRRLSLYFRSGDGWYAGWITPGDGAWRRVVLGRREFAEEGRPAGWDRVDGMRVSVWKGAENVDVRVELAALEGETREVVVLRNTLRIASGSSDAWAVKRHTRLTYRWLEEAGLRVGQLDDTDLRAGLPLACRVLLLPYNPLIDASQSLQLTRYCERGGRLIAIQSDAGPLQDLLGLRGATRMRAGAADEFEAIRRVGWVQGGLPERLPQGNDTVLIPDVGEATVIGYWEDRHGTVTKLPALTIHRRGAFIGGWLTEAGREAKTQLLLGLIGKLRPDRSVFYARELLDGAQCLLGAETWEGTRSMIVSAWRETGSTEDIAGYLQDVEQFRMASDGALERESFPQLVRRAEVLRGMVRRAYSAAVAPSADEMRAVWCHRAHGVDGLGWDEVARRISRAGVDTLIPNMVWASRAYYASGVVPRAGGVDHLASALDACRRYGLKLHVWFVCFNLDGASIPFMEQMRTDGRLQKRANGAEVAWLCPSDPRNRRYHLSVVEELARNYPIDGVMLDYIRYPDAESCYCAGCRKRFEAALGGGALAWPDAVRGGDYMGRYQAWRREQITTLVDEIRQALVRVRPGSELSAAVYRSWPGCRDGMGQDWVAWLRSGALDFACPMNYERDHALFETQLRGQLAAAGKGARIYPGIGVTHPGLPPEETVHQVRLSRRAGARGFILFDLERDVLDQHLPLLRDGPTAASGRAP